ncbi:MAG TPA: RnfH family protein [Burkholderiaceae bacterium]|nr:RnfH family protein [Burkholderiaceae bacterium]
MAHADADLGALLNVSVVYSPRAGEVDEVLLRLAPGATVADAVRASGLQERHPQAGLDALPVGVWGTFCQRGDALRDRDRVELYRPLKVDPKEARRRRQQAQRAPKKG